MSVIDEIKQKLDIVEVVGEYVTLTKAGRTFKGLCPLHSEKHPSFYVYPEQQSWHCFGACNSGGDVFSFIMKKQNISFGEALRLLAQKAGVSIPQTSKPEAEQKELERLYQANEAAAQYFHDLLNSEAAEKAKNYLISRGLEAKTVASFNLGYSLSSWEALKQHLAERGYATNELLKAGLILEAENGQTRDRFRNKLMFPIYNVRGRIIGFGARVLDEKLPKYINSPQTPMFDKSSSLYGINLAVAAIREQDSAIIVEGYMDVLTAHQNGFSNVVASMGTSVTERQVASLKKLSRNIALALDADAAGEEAMLRSVSYENILGAEVRIIQMPEGKDPDEVIKENASSWQQLLGKALPVVDYYFNRVTSSLDLERARDKSEAADKLLPIIAEIKDMVRQAHYLQKLARLIKVSQRSLETLLAKVKSSQSKFKALGPKEETAQAPKPFLSSPVEEYCLTLLLKYPELKAKTEGLLPEYFENSENREIFLAWQEVGDLESLKERLDNTIWEHVLWLVARSLPSEQIESRWKDCLLRLQQIYFTNLARKREEALVSKPELQLTIDELGKFQEPAKEISDKLKEIFAQKKRQKQGAREVENGLSQQ